MEIADLTTNWVFPVGRSVASLELQNTFNTEIFEAVKRFTELCGFLFKSLIHQESSYKPKVINIWGYAGLTQMHKASCDEVSRRYYADIKRHGKSRIHGPMFYPSSCIRSMDSVLGGAAYFCECIYQIYLQKFPGFDDNPEKWLFCMAAYNGGKGLIEYCMRLARKEQKKEYVDLRWADIIKYKSDTSDSVLWRSILKLPNGHNWIKHGKYDEISQYPFMIWSRAYQGQRTGMIFCQKALSYLDLYLYRLDGVYGDGTRNGLITYQKHSDLEPHGFPDYETEQKLRVVAINGPYQKFE